MFNKAAFKRFGRDEKGNVMLMTALIATPLLVTVAVAVDTAEIYRAKATYQNAVDAAALTVAKQIKLTGDQSIAVAEGTRVFNANVGKNLPNSTGAINFVFDPNSSGYNCGKEGIKAVATLRHPVFLDGVFKAAHEAAPDKYDYSNPDPDHATLGVETVVKCGNSTTEIAMVLDNSGSMRGGKIATLITEAKKLVDTLHKDAPGPDAPAPTMFSLVPFSTFVNVGPDNRNASWMDTLGQSPIHNENLDWAKDPQALPVALGDGTFSYVHADSGEPLTRFSIYDALNVEWKGCVEQRPYPYHTRDTEPAAGDYKSLFVPSFAPDQPDDWSGQTDKVQAVGLPDLYCTEWRFHGNGDLHRCRWFSDGTRAERGSGGAHYTGFIPNKADYNSAGVYQGNTGTGIGWVDADNINEVRYTNNYVRDDHNFPDDPSQHVRSKENTGIPNQQKRQSWTWKYFQDSAGNSAEIGDVQAGDYGYHGNGDPIVPTVFGFPGGPNNFCTTAQLTPLTADKDDIKGEIDKMFADGATNIQHGIMWGWRSLTSGAPLTEGRPKSDEDNRKVMIVMTDGNSTYYTSESLGAASGDHNISFYGAHGHQKNGRIYEGYDEISNPTHNNETYTKAMDEHMEEACENVQDDGIQVYTIAFDVPNGSSVKALLEQCASLDKNGKRQYYDAQNSDELAAAFADIANNISETAISR